MNYIGADDFALILAMAVRPLLVQFSGERCGLCRAIEPMMDQVAARYEGRLIFVKLDIAACASIAEANNVRRIPTLMLFDRGEAVARFSAGKTMSRITAFIDSHIDDDVSADAAADVPSIVQGRQIGRKQWSADDQAFVEASARGEGIRHFVAQSL